MADVENESRRKGLFSDDFFVGAAIVLFAVSIFAQIPGSYGDVMLFPKIVGIASLICGLLIVITDWFRSAERRYGGFGAETVAMGISAVIFALMLLNGVLGFFTCLFLVCFEINALIAWFCGERGAKSILRSLALSLAMCASIYVVFGVILGILTPRGLFI